MGEIAEEYNVSRQAVYDNIKRTEAMIEEYEEKLLLFNKFQERNEILDQLRQKIEEPSIDSSLCLKLIDDLEILD